MIKDKSIFIKNIYYMLAYAYQSLQQENYKDIATEKFDNVHNLLAAILAKGVAFYSLNRDCTESMSIIRIILCCCAENKYSWQY